VSRWDRDARQALADRCVGRVITYDVVVWGVADGTWDVVVAVPNVIAARGRGKSRAEAEQDAARAAVAALRLEVPVSRPAAEQTLCGDFLAEDRMWRSLLPS
jgi:predicted RNase H-like HicB family nuclease